MSKRVVISTSNLNRNGFRVLTSGISLEQYTKNPIMLYMHFRPWRGAEDEIKPIGTVTDLRLEGDSLSGLPVFSQTYAFAREIEQMWEEGTFNMVSAGLEAVEWSNDPVYLLPGQTRETLLRSKLEEISIVDIGANDDALAIKNMATGQMIQLKDGADIGFIPVLQNDNNPKKGNNMNKILLKLGLMEGATEEQAIAIIEAMQGENKAVRLQAIKDSVKLAIDEKRITEDKRTHFEALGETIGVEQLRITLQAIPQQKVIKPSTVINMRSGVAVGGTDKKWDEMTGAERIELRDTDKEAYMARFHAYYGFMPEVK